MYHTVRAKVVLEGESSVQSFVIQSESVYEANVMIQQWIDQQRDAQLNEVLNLGKSIVTDVVVGEGKTPYVVKLEFDISGKKPKFRCESILVFADGLAAAVKVAEKYADKLNAEVIGASRSRLVYADKSKEDE